jgi:hypothetical protein
MQIGQIARFDPINRVALAGFPTLKKTMHNVQKEEHGVNPISPAHIEPLRKILAVQFGARPPVL